MTPSRSLRLHIARELVRHGYPWVPTNRSHDHPQQWILPTRRPADMSVGPPNQTCGHEDAKTAWHASQGNPDRKAAWISLPYCNRLEIGFPVVIDLDSGSPTLNASQYKMGKGVLLGTGHHVLHHASNTDQELDVGFYSPEARNSIK
jgi:hypothetical protein